VTHFVAAVAPLASAVSRAARLVSSVTAPVVLSGSGGRVEFSAGLVFGSADAVVAEPGRVIVGLRALATVLGGLSAADVELRLEGTRLAVRTPSARYALPTLTVEPPSLPALAVLGVASGLREAAGIVAGAASRDGLPLFTGVRLRSAGERLTLVATDRFRAAIASIPWAAKTSAAVDALVPASVLASAVRYVQAETPIRAAEDWFGVDWTGGGMVTPGLALPFPDSQIEALMRAEPVAQVSVLADELAGAVDRVAPFAGEGIELALFDGLVAVRGSGEAGEAREEVKASTSGDHVSVSFQPAYLADAARAFAGGMVRIEVQQGIRPTVFSAGDVRYLVVPLRRP
jgi:DNA polymerase III subunit beta